MSELLLVEIEFNSKTWYLSEEGYIGENYYAPYLSETPSLELGEVKGGYIGVRIGDLSIANRPNDRFSPFSIFGGGYSKLLANPNQKINVQIYWQQNLRRDSLFDGTMYLSGFDTDSFNFLLEDKIADVDLLTTARDIKSSLASVNSISIRGDGAEGVVTAPDHGLKEGDLIQVTSSVNYNVFNTLNSDNETIDVPVIKVDDGSGGFDPNFFRYAFTQGQTSTDYDISSNYSINAYTQKPQPFSFGVVEREKDIIQTAEITRASVGEKSGFEYSNPDLKVNSSTNPITLFDDGVLVGIEDNTKTGNLSAGGGGSITASAIVREGDFFRITTSSSHGLVIGSTVKLSGFNPAELNTTGAFYVVADVPSNNNFTIFARIADDQAISVGTGKIETPGEYFGVDREPTETTIFSRAFFNDLAAYDANTQTPVRAIGGTNLTSKDGSVIYGTPLVSGISTNGETLSEFFEFIANKVGVTNVDFSDAPNASSLKLRIWQTSQTKAIEFAGEVSYAANHLFEIKNDTLRAIDRSYQPDSFIQINNWEIVSAAYKMPTPVKALRTKWDENVINPKTIPTSLSTRGESVMISNSSSGEIVDIIPVTKNQEVAIQILESIREILNKSVITIRVGNIRSDFKVGTRIKANRDEDGVSIDMVIRTINYEFGELETEIVGDGTISVIEQDQVY